MPSRQGPNKNKKKQKQKQMVSKDGMVAQLSHDMQ